MLFFLSVESALICTFAWNFCFRLPLFILLHASCSTSIRFSSSKVAPFKLKFSKMSKSESSARGDSLDLPGDGDTEQGSVSTPETVCVQDSLPSSPPPTYEDVLEEVTCNLLDRSVYFKIWQLWFNNAYPLAVYYYRWYFISSIWILIELGDILILFWSPNHNCEL